MAVLEQRPRRRFTVQEVLRMVETGILTDDEPVELLNRPVDLRGRRRLQPSFEV
jgi:predicted PP-loop superfamily ATPase